MITKNYKAILSIFIILTIVTSFSLNSFALEETKKDCRKSIDSQSVFNDIKYLSSSDNFPSPDFRMSGTDGETKASKFVSNRFERLGLEVEEQDFSFDSYNIEGYLKDLTNNIEIDTLYISGNTPDNKPEFAQLVNINKGTTADFEAIGDNILDKVVLIENSVDTDIDYIISIKDKVKGFIIYLNQSETIESETESQSYNSKNEELKEKLSFFSNGLVEGTKLSKKNKGIKENLNINESDEDIPMFLISYENGLKYKEKLESGKKIELEIYANMMKKTFNSKNVIGTYKSKIRTDKTIVICAHYDGVNTPAANDNASGTAVMMEMARVLKNKRFDFNIKYIAFGSEELGLYGSKYYVNNLSDEEKENILYAINLDMVGVGDKLGIFKALDNSDSELQDITASIAEKKNINFKAGNLPNSDHLSFDLADIKSIMLLYLDDPNYHTPNDTYENLLKSNIENNNIENTCKLVKKLVNKLNSEVKEKNEKEYELKKAG